MRPEDHPTSKYTRLGPGHYVRFTVHFGGTVHRTSRRSFRTEDDAREFMETLDPKTDPALRAEEHRWLVRPGSREVYAPET